MPLNWADVPDPANPPAGALALSAANLAKLAVIADIGVAGTPTGNAARAAYVAQGVTDMQKVGDGADPTSGTSENVKLLVTANRTNPSNVFEQHFVGYSFYSGTPQAGVGTLQGGSCESYAYANGTADMGTVLGFEGIGRGDGDDARRKVGTVIGLLGSALIGGAANNDLIVGVRARANSNGSTGTVTEARSLDIQEPTVGTTRRAAYIVGTTRLVGGTAANTLEIAAASGPLSWSASGPVIKGYASDGASVRLTLDSQDTPTAGRVNSSLFGSGKHLSLSNSGSEVVSVTADGTLTLAGGQLKYGNPSNQTTGGGSAALGANSPAVSPTAPNTWWKVTLADGSQGFIPVWK